MGLKSEVPGWEDPPQLVFPLGRIFSAKQRSVGARANNFWQCGKNIALKNSTNLGNMTFGILYYSISKKIRAHKRLFGALGTIVSRKFGYWPISQKVRGNTASIEFSKILNF